MGISKTDCFSDHQNEMAKIIKAIGHPARIAIIEYLAKVNTCICGDIVGHIPLAQSTISQHLKELKNAGLIKGTIEGTSLCYCLDEETMQRVIQYFTSIQSMPKSKLCC